MLTMMGAVCKTAGSNFLERARAVKPRFAPDQRPTAMMTAICRRLDGIPLAIELAAARAATLAIEELAARIDDRFDLLAGGRRTALPRHQTLRATLDWSHDLLPELERVILRRLAVFAAAFNFEAASAVASGPDIRPSDFFDGLTNLVMKSLVATDFNNAEVRYRLLDTARAYARDKLLASGELPAMSRRLAEHYRHRLQSLNNGDEASLEITQRGPPTWPIFAQPRPNRWFPATTFSARRPAWSPSTFVSSSTWSGSRKPLVRPARETKQSLRSTRRRSAPTGPRLQT
jgi:predicted ATPase